MSSTEAHLRQFELEICPLQFRLAVLSGDSMLLGYKPDGTGKLLTVTTPYEGHEQQIERTLESLDWLLLANNVLDTPVTAPNCVFNPMYMKAPSVHLLIYCNDDRKWGSMYKLDALPDNIRNLVDQAQYLAIQSLDKPSDEAATTD